MFLSLSARNEELATEHNHQLKLPHSEKLGTEQNKNNE
jgi:hypothetical protein